MNFEKPYKQYEGKWISYEGDKSFVLKYMGSWGKVLRFAVMKEGSLMRQSWLSKNSDAFITKRNSDHIVIKSIFKSDKLDLMRYINGI
jgi:hypothetical protein